MGFNSEFKGLMSNICVQDTLKTDKLCVSANRNLLGLLFLFTVENYCEKKCVLQEHSKYLAEKQNRVSNNKKC